MGEPRDAPDAKKGDDVTLFDAGIVETEPPPVVLRPYQQDALTRVFEEWAFQDSTLLVLPTGTGKTIVFAAVIDKLWGGRAMVIAHREELIEQALNKILAVTGHAAEIEMAERWADQYEDRSPVVVSSVQTQCSGRRKRRMERFDPHDFSLLIVDEAHHATADTYRRVIDHYRQNTNLKVLGVTATPDRRDEEALGQIFDSVAYNYEIPDAITDGWLVPIDARPVYVTGLDFSKCKTTAGDLNQGDLDLLMREEGPLHKVADSAYQITEGRKALIFAVTVAHAERLAEILNRHRPGCARWVCGKTPKDERRGMFRDYAAGRFQFLVNVGVATEGFDEPSIECVVVARPTKSRALFAQMIGRGTRALPGVVDGPETPEARRQAIADSGKPRLEVLDFVGNSGKHKLVTAADILGGNYSDDVVDRAREIIERETDKPAPVAEALEQAKAEAEAARKRKRHLVHRRAGVIGKATFSVGTSNLFDLLDISPQRERGWNRGRAPTENQVAFLAKHKVNMSGLTFTDASALIGGIINRRNRGLCSPRQSKQLARCGVDPAEVTIEQASRMMAEIKAAGWRRPRCWDQ